MSSPAPLRTPDLLYGETEEDLRAALRSLLTDQCDPAHVLAGAERGAALDERLWTSLADMGLPGLLVPEKLGGQGAGHREAAVVLEELGRTVAPVPFLTSSVIATETLLACDTGQEYVAGLLRELGAGRVRAALAVPFTAGPDDVTPLPGPQGTVRAVAGALGAGVLLVPTEQGLYAVDTEPADLTPLTSLDLTRPLADVRVEPGRATLVADAATARAAVRRGLLAGAGLLASEQLGVAEWCLTEAVRHTRERHQFNRPVGSFQALKHRMAQLWLEIVNARAAARNAADALAADDPEIPLAVALAQAYCSRVAVHAAEECVQLHGGIGMTWEHPAHLSLKRAKTDQVGLGSAGRHREALAALAGLPGPEA
ncbi:acyl-CoA dehydrogenase family protein [Streptomyces sp. NPDC001941]|uniref:acyl-CoA dehydrogenase family protein n=1 Tax=Streptomyces sp. NPDC001941 TaxID=3154659 RepID=UPI00332C761E